MRRGSRSLSTRPRQFKGLLALPALATILPPLQAHTSEPWVPTEYRQLIEHLDRDGLQPGSPSERLHGAATHLALLLIRMQVSHTEQGLILTDAADLIQPLRLSDAPDEPLDQALAQIEAWAGRLAGPLPDGVIRQRLMEGVARSEDRWARVYDHPSYLQHQGTENGGDGQVDLDLQPERDAWLVTRAGPSIPSLQAGDRVLSINGLRVRPAHPALDPTHGPISQPVTLRVLPQDGGAPRTLLAARTLPSHPPVELDPSDRTLWILRIKRIPPDVGEQVSRQWRAESRHQPPPHLLAVDLRGTRGGSLQAAHDLMETLMGPASVGQAVHRDGSILPLWEPSPDPGPGLWRAPTALTVLLDHETASAAEWVAAVLRRRAGARLVGLPSSGKAEVQTHSELNATWHLSHSTARLVDPSGAPWFSSTGLQPDEWVVIATDPEETASRLPLNPLRLPRSPEIWSPSELTTKLVREAAPSPPHQALPATTTAALWPVRWSEGPGLALLSPSQAPPPAPVLIRAPSTVLDGWWLTSDPITRQLPPSWRLASGIGRALPIEGWAFPAGQPPRPLGWQPLDVPGHPAEVPPLTLKLEPPGLELTGHPSHPDWTVQVQARGGIQGPWAQVNWPDGVSHAQVPLPDGDRYGLDLHLSTPDDTLRISLPVGWLSTQRQTLEVPRIDAPDAPTFAPPSGVIRWPVSVEGPELNQVVLRVDEQTLFWWRGRPRLREDVSVPLSRGLHQIQVYADRRDGVRVRRQWDVFAP